MNKYALLAGAAVFALTSTNVMATPVTTNPASAPIDAEITLVSTVELAQVGTGLNFGKFVSVPGQTITIGGNYQDVTNEEMGTSSVDLVTSTQHGTSINNGPVHYRSLGEGSLGQLKITASGLDFTYSYHPSEHDDIVGDGWGLFDISFSNIPLETTAGVPCGTVVPSFVSYEYNYDISGGELFERNYDADASVIYYGGTFTQVNDHIDGRCTGQGTATLVLSLD